MKKTNKMLLTAIVGAASMMVALPLSTSADITNEDLGPERILRGQEVYENVKLSGEGWDYTLKDVEIHGDLDVDKNTTAVVEGNVRVLRGGLRLKKGGNIVIQEGSSLTIVEGSNPSTLNGKIILSEGSKLEFDGSENVDLSQLESLDIEEGAKLVIKNYSQDPCNLTFGTKDTCFGSGNVEIYGNVECDASLSPSLPWYVKRVVTARDLELGRVLSGKDHYYDIYFLEEDLEYTLEDSKVEGLYIGEGSTLRIKGEVKIDKLISDGKIVVESGGKLTVSRSSLCNFYDIGDIKVEDGGELICILDNRGCSRFRRSEFDLKPGSKFKIIGPASCEFVDDASINIEEGAELIFENNNSSGKKIEVNFRSDREKYTGKGVVQFIGKGKLEIHGMKVFPWRVKMPPVGEELEFFNGLLKREEVELERSGCYVRTAKMITLYIGHFGGEKIASIRGRVYEFSDGYCNYEFVYDDK